jgi:hypothetical protein
MQPVTITTKKAVPTKNKGRIIANDLSFGELPYHSQRHVQIVTCHSAAPCKYGNPIAPVALRPDHDPLRYSG